MAAWVPLAKNESKGFKQTNIRHSFRPSPPTTLNTLAAPPKSSGFEQTNRHSFTHLGPPTTLNTLAAPPKCSGFEQTNRHSFTLAAPPKWSGFEQINKLTNKALNHTKLSCSSTQMLCPSLRTPWCFFLIWLSCALLALWLPSSIHTWQAHVPHTKQLHTYIHNIT